MYSSLIPDASSSGERQYEQQRINVPPPLTQLSNSPSVDSIWGQLDHSEASRLSKLDVVLSRHPHLDLSGQLHRVSPAPHGLGGQSDIFTAYLTPSGSNSEVKVSVKRLRIHIIPDDVKCQRVRGVSLE